MASIKHYANGLGGTTGSRVATGTDVQLSGNVYYVGNAVAGASDANAGTERTKPKATIAGAVAVYAANDTIVVLSGHAESITSTVTFNRAATRIVGEGSGSSAPRFTGAATTVIFDVTADCVSMDNFTFPASTAVVTTRLRVPSGAFSGTNLRFECGANDTNAAMIWNDASGGTGAVLTLNGCTWTAVASQPAIGISFTQSTTALYMTDCTFDGGSFGWSDYAWKSSVATFSMTVTGLSLLNGSHVLLPTGSNGFIQTDQATGDSRIDWTA